MKCPKCGANEENIDWRLDAKNKFHWECFECNHEWITDNAGD